MTDLVREMVAMRADLDRKREAGAEAIGILIALLGTGDLPHWCRGLAQEVVDKYSGITTTKETT